MRLLFAAGGIGGAAYVEVAEVVEHGAVVVGHAASEVGIAEAAIARGLRHILQDAEFLLNGLLALPRHLAPTGQHIGLDVVALLGSQAAPGIFLFAQIGALLRGHTVPLAELVADPILLFGRQVLKGLAASQNALALLRCEIAHLVDEGARSTSAELLARSQPGAAIRPFGIGAGPVVRAGRAIARIIGSETVGAIRTDGRGGRTIRIRLKTIAGLRLSLPRGRPVRIRVACCRLALAAAIWIRGSRRPIGTGMLRGRTVRAGVWFRRGRLLVLRWTVGMLGVLRENSSPSEREKHRCEEKTELEPLFHPCSAFLFQFPERTVTSAVTSVAGRRPNYWHPPEEAAL